MFQLRARRGTVLRAIDQRETPEVRKRQCDRDSSLDQQSDVLHGARRGIGDHPAHGYKLRRDFSKLRGVY